MVFWDGQFNVTFKFIPDDPCCHGNEIWDKNSHNSACIRDISAMFASDGGIRGQAIKWCQWSFRTTTPGCHSNEIWDKNGYMCSVIPQCQAVALDRWGVKWNHLSMTHKLTTDYAKNYCNWTLIVQVILENVVTCFFLEHSVYNKAVVGGPAGPAMAGPLFLPSV